MRTREFRQRSLRVRVIGKFRKSKGRVRKEQPLNSIEWHWMTLKDTEQNLKNLINSDVRRDCILVGRSPGAEPIKHSCVVGHIRTVLIISFACECLSEHHQQQFPNCIRSFRPSEYYRGVLPHKAAESPVEQPVAQSTDPTNWQWESCSYNKSLVFNVPNTVLDNGPLSISFIVVDQRQCRHSERERETLTSAFATNKRVRR